MTILRTSARRVLLLLTVMMLAIATLPAPAAAASAPATELQRLLAIANDEVGSRYAFSATGPNKFDCSGFVYYVFREAGLLDRIGGKRRTVAGYRKWFSNNGEITKGIASARPGDVLIWGKNKHTGIYLGDGYAISALVNPYGVRVHKYNKISLKLTAVLRVNLER
jgi:cell wall-associated NlpC family hydrolase